MYTTVQSMTDRFGVRELAQLSNKMGELGGSCTDDTIIDDTRIQVAIKDACAIIDQYLSCCFNIKTIRQLIASGSRFQILDFWNATIARYLLYDMIKLSSESGQDDHEAYRRYKQTLKDIEKFCECENQICDDTYLNCIDKTGDFKISVQQVGCRIPDDICELCKKDSCGCECHA
jgi:phage gp36-like protein